MTDNLRDRIAKAISDAQFAFDHGEPYNGPEDAAVLADAVMAVVSDEYVNSRGMFHEPDRCLGCEECYE